MPPLIALFYTRDVMPGTDDLLCDLCGSTQVPQPVSDQYYGDWGEGGEDPQGYARYIETHMEDIAESELVRRAGARHGS